MQKLMRSTLTKSTNVKNLTLKNFQKLNYRSITLKPYTPYLHKCRALLLIALAMPCLAMAGGFVDERSSIQTAAGSSGAPMTKKQAGTLTGDFSLGQWSQPAPASRSEGSRLGLALVRLMPVQSGAGTLSINAAESVMDSLVDWPSGLTRQGALDHIATQYGWDIAIYGQSIKVAAVAAVAATNASASAANGSSTGSTGSYFASSPYIVPLVSTVLVPVPVAVIAQTNLQPGTSVSTQLQDMAERAGYKLAWEVSDFTVDQVIPMGNDFIKALETLIESVNADGTHIKAVIYKGNNLVRVTAL